MEKIEVFLKMLILAFDESAFSLNLLRSLSSMLQENSYHLLPLSLRYPRPVSDIFTTRQVNLRMWFL